MRCQWYGSALADAHGQVHSLLAMGLDVAAQRRAAAALERARDELEARVLERTRALEAANAALVESRQRLHEVVATVPGVLYQGEAYPDGSFRMSYVSPAEHALYGLPEGAMVEDWTRGVHPQDLPEMRASMGRAIAEQRPWSHECRAITADGQVRWTRKTATPVRRLGEVTVYTGVILDVTEEHQAKQAVAQSERRFRTLAEGSIQGIVVEDVEAARKPLYVNDAAARMYGYASGEQVMRLDSLEHLLPDSLRAQGLADWQRLKRGELGRVQGRIPTLHRDGHTLWVEIMGSVVMWDGSPALQLTLLDVTERRRMEEELQRLAATDPLTGLLNRRQFRLLAEQELRRAHRHPAPVTVLMLDLDHFKQINDRYGHGAGDEVIRRFAATARAELRESDLLCRAGGEEFVALLLDAELDQARQIAERLRRVWAAEAIGYGGETLRASVSIGMAVLRPSEDLDAVLNRADRALYRAKHAGRDRVALATAD